MEHAPGVADPDLDSARPMVTFDPEELGRIAGGRPDHVRTELIHQPVAGASAGVWRVTGTVGTRPFAYVLKEVRFDPEAGNESWRATDEVASPWYWARERDLYRSDVLVTLPDDRVRAPRVRMLTDRPDGSALLWLESVGGTEGHRFDLSHYRVVARHLGRLHGRYASGEAPLPEHPALSSGWERAYTERRSHFFESFRPLTSTTADQRLLLPAAVLRAAERVWSDRSWYHDQLDRLPKVLTHFDFHPANLFVNRDSDGVTRTVVADWQFAGTGPLGYDLATLCFDAVFDFHVGGNEIVTLHDTLIDGYLTGLRAFGWNVDEAQVRSAVAIAATVKYAWAPVGFLSSLTNAAHSDPELTIPAGLNGRPLDVAAPAWSGALKWWFEMGRVARAG